MNRYQWGIAGTAVTALLGFAGYQGLHTEGLINGMTSSVQSPNHVLTMLGVGLWGAQFKRLTRWLIPLLFAGMMSVGLIAASFGYFIPYNNLLIAVSLIILALLIFGILRLKTVVGIALAASFATFQGFGHGAEIQPGVSPAAYSTGFTMASFLLQSSGILSSAAITRRFGISPLKLFAMLCGGAGVYQLFS